MLRPHFTARAAAGGADFMDDVDVSAVVGLKLWCSVIGRCDLWRESEGLRDDVLTFSEVCWFFLPLIKGGRSWNTAVTVSFVALAGAGDAERLWRQRDGWGMWTGWEDASREQRQKEERIRAGDSLHVSLISELRFITRWKSIWPLVAAVSAGPPIYLVSQRRAGGRKRTNLIKANPVMGG